MNVQERDPGFKRFHGWNGSQSHKILGLYCTAFHSFHSSATHPARHPAGGFDHLFDVYGQIVQFRFDCCTQQSDPQPTSTSARELRWGNQQLHTEQMIFATFFWPDHRYKCCFTAKVHEPRDSFPRCQRDKRRIDHQKEQLFHCERVMPQSSKQAHDLTWLFRTLLRDCRDMFLSKLFAGYKTRCSWALLQRTLRH